MDLLADVVEFHGTNSSILVEAVIGLASVAQYGQLGEALRVVAGGGVTHC